MIDRMRPRRLGMVVGGSLSEGLVVKLDPAVSIEEMAVGRYVSLQGETRRFLGMITDVSLASTDPAMASNPPDQSDPFIAKVIAGTNVFGTLHIAPQLAIGADGLSPVRTIPAHFTQVQEASEEEIQRVFGRDDKAHFYVGTPLDMEMRVHLDLQELVKRSNGVFGKSGTGKTFLTRLILAGILQKGVASTLIFDMHGEYGWRGKTEGPYEVKGLKQLFPSKVFVVTLDQESTLKKGIHADFVVHIGYDEIEPKDIETLRETLNLTDLAVQACYHLERRLGQKQWVSRLLESRDREEVVQLANEVGENENTLGALWRRLQLLRRFGFLVPHAREDSVHRILEYLDTGKHVVLEFGSYGDELAAYILVANLITRRLHDRYVERTERALEDGGRGAAPLVIIVEEAHKFLNPDVASQTTFGVIAREMRKYNVTLLVVDQRPSGIDEEVMSQLGTKLTCLLENERDIEAVLSGVQRKSELRQVLARLASKQQALIFGHAVPMPIPITVAEYGSPESYKALNITEETMEPGQIEKEIQELWGN